MWFALLACAPPEISFDPDVLDFGEVDLAGEPPDGGHATAPVDLTNVSAPSVNLSLPAYDADRLCLAGFDADREYPVALGALDTGSTYSFVVGICGVLPAEIDTDVETELVVETDGTPSSVTLPITFHPIRSSG